MLLLLVNNEANKRSLMASRCVISESTLMLGKLRLMRRDTLTHIDYLSHSQTGEAT